MSSIKSFSVGDGDTFYINHQSDNFTIIDCCLNNEVKDDILDEITYLSNKKGITRFISTHPDEDHIKGLTDLDKKINILNFYCVENKATKSDETDDFKKYCYFRDHERKAFNIFKGCKRRWMNQRDVERGTAGINILWPDIDNEHFKKALQQANDGGSPNNISPIIQYYLNNGVTSLWMGDLETEFMESIKDDLDLPLTDILFAPHHGRDSGKVPESMLQTMNPKIIIIGEAPAQNLNYYGAYNTITQNSAGDIVFECREGKVRIFTSNKYSVKFLVDEGVSSNGFHYLGTLNL